MTALEVIEYISKELKKNPPKTWKEEKCATEFLLKAFNVMREIAIEWGGERITEESFEERMK